MSIPISPCLWFVSAAEEAANFYVKVFKNSKIQSISRFGKEGFEFHGQQEGSVMTVDFLLNGTAFTALNGARADGFNESISFQVFCDNQEEIDHYWESLSEGGQQGHCGWLTDKFGVYWQVVPAILPQLMSDPAKSAKVTQAFLAMKKFDLSKLEEL